MVDRRVRICLDIAVAVVAAIHNEPKRDCCQRRFFQTSCPFRSGRTVRAMCAGNTKAKLHTYTARSGYLPHSIDVGPPSASVREISQELCRVVDQMGLVGDSPGFDAPGSGIHPGGRRRFPPG